MFSFVLPYDCNADLKRLARAYAVGMPDTWALISEFLIYGRGDDVGSELFDHSREILPVAYGTW